MDELVIIGGGGHGVSVFEVVSSINNYKVIGFVDNQTDTDLARFGIQHLGTDNDLAKILNDSISVAIGLGQIGSPSPRMTIVKKLNAQNAHLPVIKARSAVVSSNCEVGQGTVIFHQALINADSHIGKFNIVNSSALVEHGVVTDEFVHIAPGAVVLGDVTIGMGSFIGAGAILREGINIGANCLIGAGAFVSEDVMDGQTARK